MSRPFMPRGPSALDRQRSKERVAIAGARLRDDPERYRRLARRAERHRAELQAALDAMRKGGEKQREAYEGVGEALQGVLGFASQAEVHQLLGRDADRFTREIRVAREAVAGPHPTPAPIDGVLVLLTFVIAEIGRLRSRR